MRAFITGSRAYGKPREDSDIDLVVRVSGDAAELLWDLSEDDKSCRFGRLNLILCTTDEKFAAWKVATQQMIEGGKKLSRVAAKEIILSLMESVGIPRESSQNESGGTEE